jgi:hypothetical protein
LGRQARREGRASGQNQGKTKERFHAVYYSLCGAEVKNEMPAGLSSQVQFIKVLGTHSYSNCGWFSTAKWEKSSGVVEYWSNGFMVNLAQKIT